MAHSGRTVFLDREHYLSTYPQFLSYDFLPFRFLRLNEQTKIIVNEVGEYLTVPNDTFEDFVYKRLVADGALYKELKAKHFLVDDKSKLPLELLATKLRTKKGFLAGFTKLHLFVVSLRCDHSCHYCQVSRQSEDKMSYDMSKETALRSLELMFRSPSQYITMEFQGGEPLLNFDLIKFCVEEAKKINEVAGKNLDIVICTNMSKLTDEILGFCKKHEISLSISLDGPEWLHNLNRPNRENTSYGLTVDGIAKARKALGVEKVAALMTTTKKSLSHPKEIIDEYVRLDFKSIFLRSLSPYGFATKTAKNISYSADEFVEFYKRGLDYIIELNLKGIDFIEVYSKIILTKILTPFSTNFMDLLSPASAGIGVVVFNYDGNVFATDESRMLYEMGDSEFCLGNVHKDNYEGIFINPSLMAIIEKSVAESLPGCSDCAFVPYCGGDPVYHYAVQGDLEGHRPTSDFCKKNMEIIRYLFHLMETGGEDIQKVFWAWIWDESVRNIDMAFSKNN